MLNTITNDNTLVCKMNKNMQLNNSQLNLLKEYCSSTVKNNQEVHPSDMPPVVSMFRILAEKGYTTSEEQVGIICKSLHSLANLTQPTSEYLQDFLNDVAMVYRYQVNGPKNGKFKRSIEKIADDIVNEQNIEFWGG